MYIFIYIDNILVFYVHARVSGTRTNRTTAAPKT